MQPLDQANSVIHWQAAPFSFVFHAVAAVEWTAGPQEDSKGFLVVIIRIGAEIWYNLISVDFLKQFCVQRFEYILYFACYHMVKRVAGIGKVLGHESGMIPTDDNGRFRAVLLDFFSKINIILY